DQVIVQVEGQCHGQMARAHELLIKHYTETVVINPHATEFFRHGKTQQAVLAGRLPHLARNLVVLLPLGVFAGNLPGVELGSKFTELLVVLFEERAFHRGSTFRWIERRHKAHWLAEVHHPLWSLKPNDAYSPGQRTIQVTN